LPVALDNFLQPAQARTDESNGHRREDFRRRGSRRMSAVAQLFSSGDFAMSDLPKLISLFTPPAEQPVVPEHSGDYVGVYAVGSHITIVTKQPPGFSFPEVEGWRPIFNCDLPEEIASAGSGRFFVVWFSGIPSKRGRFGSCVRQVRVTHITKTTEGRDLRPDEYVR